MTPYRFRPLLILLLLISPFSAMASCEVSEKQILGAWTQTDAKGFFEDIEFESDGKIRTFNSWLHQRPEMMDATWQLNDCRLSIVSAENKNLSFSFSVALSKGQLLLKGEKDGVVSKYKRAQ